MDVIDGARGLDARSARVWQDTVDQPAIHRQHTPEGGEDLPGVVQRRWSGR